MVRSLDAWSVTLTVTVARVALLLGVAFYAAHNKTYPGFKTWVAAIGMGILSLLSLVLRPLAPGLSIILTNFLAPMNAVMMVDGCVRFARGHSLDRRWYAIPVLNCLLSSFFYFAWDRMDVRIWLTGLVITGTSLAATRIWLGDCPESARRLYRATALLFACYAPLFLGRALAWSFFPVTPDLMARGGPEGLSFLIMGVLDVNLVAAILMLNGQRLEADLRTSTTQLQVALQDLQEKTAEIKVLTGILPICSHCKQIRDSEGAWTPVEEYVRHRTEARFSHGFCPSCLRALYPDLVDEVS